MYTYIGGFIVAFTAMFPVVTVAQPAGELDPSLVKAIGDQVRQLAPDGALVLEKGGFDAKGVIPVLARHLNARVSSLGKERVCSNDQHRACGLRTGTAALFSISEISVEEGVASATLNIWRNVNTPYGPESYYNAYKVIFARNSDSTWKMSELVVLIET